MIEVATLRPVYLPEVSPWLEGTALLLYLPHGAWVVGPLASAEAMVGKEEPWH